MAGIREGKAQLKRRIEMISVFKGTSYRWNTLSVVLLALLVIVGLTNAVDVARAADSTEVEPPPERTLTFPENPAWIESSEGGTYSVRHVHSSRLRIRDWESDDQQTARGSSDWNDLGEALGTVTVPAGKELFLSVVGNPWGSLSPLLDLPPDTFQSAQFWKRLSADTSQWITRSDLRVLAGQRTLRTLKFLNRPLSDDLLAELPAMISVRELSLEGAQITDAGLVHIAEMPGLESLNLKATLVTDAGMVLLSDMPSLNTLSLDFTDIGDTGLANLRYLSTLEVLSINNTKVTDAGLAHLKELPALREVFATNTLVTAEGFDQLPHVVPVETEPFVRGQIRVGLIMSRYQAMAGENNIGRQYGYTHQKSVLRALIDCGFDVYAIIDPGSKELGELPDILKGAGIDDVVIESTNLGALEGLDVIVSGVDYFVITEALIQLKRAVKGGVGFINFSLHGGKPDQLDIASEMMGMEPRRYYYKFADLTSRVLATHPILGPLREGDSFEFSWLDGRVGPVDGTPLLDTPDGVNEAITPLYVHQFGAGRVVNFQATGLRDPAPNFTAQDFLTRCVLWAAKFPLD